jgi:thiol reductant ABC exporter CydC subunit
MRALARLMRHEPVPRGQLVLSGALSLGALAAGVGLLAVSGYLISRAAERPPVLALATAMATVRALSVGRALLRYLERLVSHDLALRMLGRLRAGTFARLMPLVPAGLPRARAGDLLARVVGDVDALQNLYLRALVPPVVAAVAVVVAGLSAAAILSSAGVALAATLAAACLGVPLLAAVLARTASRRQAAERAALSVELVDVIEGAPELVALGRRDDALARVAEADERLLRVARRHAAVAGLSGGLEVALTGAAALAALVLSAQAVQDGRMDGVLLAALVLMALAAFEAAGPLPAAAQHLAATARAAGRLEEVLDGAPPAADPVHPRRPGPGRVLIAEGVGVRHDPDGEWALHAVDLRLERGRRVAVVGPSGSGKTTLAETLVRLRDPDGGRVLLDGHRLAEYAQADVRRAVCLVPQGAHLFAATLGENLRVARPGAGDHELWDALARAGLAGWARELPQGLETLVGEQGGRLSGGERQRVALARGLLSGAGILVLDEPTRHLDPETERAFLDDLLGAADDRGLLVITHRLVGLERFDEVVVLEAGQVVERGTADRLAARGGRYAAMRRAAAAGGPAGPA